MTTTDVSAPTPPTQPGTSIMGPASLVVWLIPTCVVLVWPLVARGPLFEVVPLAFFLVLAALPLAFILGVAALSFDVRRGRRWAWAGAGGLVFATALPLITSAIRLLGVH